MFYQIFLLPPVKRSTIIKNKHGICELLRDLPNDFGLKRPSAESPCQNFVNTSEKFLKNKLNFSRSALFQIKTRVSLKYFVNDCSSRILNAIFDQ